MEARLSMGEGGGNRNRMQLPDNDRAFHGRVLERENRTFESFFRYNVHTKVCTSQYSSGVARWFRPSQHLNFQISKFELKACDVDPLRTVDTARKNHLILKHLANSTDIFFTNFSDGLMKVLLFVIATSKTPPPLFETSSLLNIELQPSMLKK
jgi:hypothetical protein